MKEKEITKKLISTFSITRVGYISEYVEPISCYASLEEARRMLDSQEGLTSIPVEREGGVVGLISRDTIMKKSQSFWGSMRNSALDKYKDPNTMIIDAQENAEKALDYILSQNTDQIYNDFLIYHNGKFFGTGTFLKLTKHITALRNMDLEQAKRMQDFFMNKRIFSHPELSVEKYVKMVHELGGDFYQLLEINKDLYMVSSFDVSGKGVAASLTTSLISAFFTTLDVGGHLKKFNPREIVEELNNVILEQTPDEIFIAGALLFIDTKNGDVMSYNLGYSPFYIFYNDENGKSIAKIMNPNLRPLGIDKFTDLDNGVRSFPIVDGMKIFLYSDGLTDARNGEGAMYGEENLKKFLFSKSKMKANDLLNELSSEIMDFIGNAPQADDITAIAVQFK